MISKAALDRAAAESPRAISRRVAGLRLFMWPTVPSGEYEKPARRPRTSRAGCRASATFALRSNALSRRGDPVSRHHRLKRMSVRAPADCAPLLSPADRRFFGAESRPRRLQEQESGICMNMGSDALGNVSTHALE